MILYNVCDIRLLIKNILSVVRRKKVIPNFYFSNNLGTLFITLWDCRNKICVGKSICGDSSFFEKSKGKKSKNKRHGIKPIGMERDQTKSGRLNRKTSISTLHG